MPGAELPDSFVGWLVIVGAGVAGTLAGFVFIKACNAVMGQT